MNRASPSAAEARILWISANSANHGWLRTSSRVGLLCRLFSNRPRVAFKLLGTYACRSLCLPWRPYPRERTRNRVAHIWSGGQSLGRLHRRKVALCSEAGRLSHPDSRGRPLCRMASAEAPQEPHSSNRIRNRLLLTRVPKGSKLVSWGPMILERPKSTILRSVSSVASTMRMFSGLRSLWQIPKE